MRIQGFKPTITLQDFQQEVKAHSSEEKLKPIVFAALSKFQPKDLATGLADSWLAKLEGYAQERSQKIMQGVKLFNQLGDQKDELLEFCPNFKKAKEAFKQAEQAYSTLSFLDAALAKQALKEFSSHEMSLSTTLEKLKTAQENCVCQSPWRELYDAWNALQEPNPANTCEQIENICFALKGEKLCSALKFVFLDSDQANVDSVKAHLLKYAHNSTSATPEAMEILDRQLSIAKKQAEAIQMKRLAEKNEKIKVALSSLRTSLSAYQEAKKEYLTDSSYIKYAEQKKIVHGALNELASFCILSELTGHGKITTDSIRKLYHIAVVQ